MTSKILLGSSEFPVIASPQLINEVGSPGAIFLQKLHFFLNEEKKTKQKEHLKTHNKKKWWFHTYEKWVKAIGIYSEATIKRAVKKLIELGFIEVDQLSKNKSDRTNYYTINYEKVASFFGIEIKKEMPKQPEQPSQTNQKIVGTDQPIHKQASHSDLDTIQIKHREMYAQLRRLKVDIAFDDSRLSYWCINAKKVIAYASSASSRLDINRWQWHTPEQIFPKEFLGITI